MKRKLALSLAVLLLPLSAAAAIEPAEEPRALGAEASIVFPSDSSIRNWRADRGRGIWIQGPPRHWHYGTLPRFWRGGDFAQAIGVETRGAGRLDKFASIIVRGERCPLTSFVTSAPPPSKRDKAKDIMGEKPAAN